MIEVKLLCHDIRTLLDVDIDCCQECHEDCDMYGYPMCYVEIGNSWAEICCRVKAAWRDKYGELGS